MRPEKKNHVMVEVFINGSLLGNSSLITPRQLLIPSPNCFIMPTSAELRQQIEKLAAMQAQQEEIEREEERLAEERRVAAAAEAERAAEAQREREARAEAERARVTMKAIIAKRVDAEVRERTEEKRDAEKRKRDSGNAHAGSSKRLRLDAETETTEEESDYESCWHCKAMREVCEWQR